jgi:hypothetical protein
MELISKLMLSMVLAAAFAHAIPVAKDETEPEMKGKLSETNFRFTNTYFHFR